MEGPEEDSLGINHEDHFVDVNQLEINEALNFFYEKYHFYVADNILPLSVISVAFDELNLVLGFRNSLIHFYNTSTLTLDYIFKLKNYPISRMLISPNSKILIVDTYSKIFAIDIETQSIVKKIIQKERPTVVKFSKDSNFLLICHRDFSYILLNLSDFSISNTNFYLQGVIKIDFSPKSEHCFITGSRCNIIVWYPYNRKKTFNLDQNVVPTNYSYLASSYEILIALTYEYEVIIWSLENFEQVASFPTHLNLVCFLTFSADYCYFIAGGKNGVKIWNSSTYELEFYFKNNSRTITDATFSKDYHYFVMCGQDYVRVYDFFSKDIRVLMYQYGTTYDLLGLVNNEKLLVVKDFEKSIFIFDIEKEFQKKEICCHKGKATSFWFDHIKQVLVTGGDDGTVKVWDMQKKEQIKDFKEHKGNVITMGKSKNEKYLVTGDSKFYVVYKFDKIWV